MSSIFEFAKQSSEAPKSTPKEEAKTQDSSIFEFAKELPEIKEISRARSLVSAPVKGFIKGGLQLVPPTHLMPSASRIPPVIEERPELAEKALEKLLPTQQKEPEKILERAGKVSTYLIGGPKQIAQKLIRGGSAVLLGYGAEKLGLPEWAQALAETGGLLTATSLKGAEKHIGSLYAQAEQLAGEAKIPAKNLVKDVHKFIKNLSKGGPAASKNPAMKQATAVLEKIKKGNIDVKELTEFKKTINEARSGLYTNLELDKSGRKLAKRNLDQISSVVDSALSEYGKSNPEWEKIYRSANEGYSGIAKSKKAANWIKRTIKAHPHATGIGLASTIIGHTLTAKPTLGVLGGYAGLKAGELITRVARSKTLRKYYKDFIEQAVRQNTAGFLNTLKRLTNQLDKEQKDEDLVENRD